MKVIQFEQFEAYAEGLIHADLRLMLPRLNQSRWEIATQSVGNIEFQFGREGSGIIADGAVNPGGMTLFVPLAGLQFANGQPLQDRCVLLLAPGSELTIASRVPHDWCSIFLPMESVIQVGICDSIPGAMPSRSEVIEIGCEAIARLRGLLVQLYHSLRSEPALSTHPAAQASIQSELLAACVPVFDSQGMPRSAMGRPPVNRREVFRHIMALIEKDEGAAVSIEELTRAANISERSLRSIFLEYVGLPPRRYLIIRRLHLARQILRRQMPDRKGVTEAAAQCGFWHFGRFANEYRQLFGELPSQTLQSWQPRLFDP